MRAAGLPLEALVGDFPMRANHQGDFEALLGTINTHRNDDNELQNNTPTPPRLAREVQPKPSELALDSMSAALARTLTGL